MSVDKCFAQLEDVIDQLVAGPASASKDGGSLDLGVSSLPPLPGGAAVHGTAGWIEVPPRFHHPTGLRLRQGRHGGLEHVSREAGVLADHDEVPMLAATDLDGGGHGDAQRRNSTHVLGEAFARQPGRFAESDDAGHVQGARAQAALVSAAVDERRQGDLRPRPDIERANALRPIHLVCAQRGEVDVHGDDVKGHASDALHGVAMKQHAALPAEGAYLGNGLQRADLVVREHDRDQRRIDPRHLALEAGEDLAIAHATMLLDRRRRTGLPRTLFGLRADTGNAALRSADGSEIAFNLTLPTRETDPVRVEATPVASSSARNSRKL